VYSGPEESRKKRSATDQTGEGTTKRRRASDQKGGGRRKNQKIIGERTTKETENEGERTEANNERGAQHNSTSGGRRQIKNEVRTEKQGPRP